MRQFTMVAGKATEFATLFRATFAAGFDAPGHYSLDLTAPTGPSTAGGKQALQHILIVPKDGSPASVIGGVNQPAMTAEIRTFRHLAELHAMRFKGARLPVDPNAYGELTRKLGDFFVMQGMAVVMVDLSETPRATASPPLAAPSRTPWIIAGVAVMFALGLGAVAAGLALSRRGEVPAPAPSVSASASTRAR